MQEKLDVLIANQQAMASQVDRIDERIDQIWRAVMACFAIIEEESGGGIVDYECGEQPAGTDVPEME